MSVKGGHSLTAKLSPACRHLNPGKEGKRQAKRVKAENYFLTQDQTHKDAVLAFIFCMWSNIYNALYLRYKKGIFLYASYSIVHDI